MISTKKLWVLLGLVLLGTFLILGLFGIEVYRKAPPIPEQILEEGSKKVLITKEDILHGQQVWQSIGGQHIGSIWGHGAYQAPDWSADWLHREALALLGRESLKEYEKAYSEINEEQKAFLQERLRRELRKNTYQAETGVVTVSKMRAEAIQETALHYEKLFGDAGEYEGLRESYALQNNAVPDLQKRHALTAFFFWTAWACTTERPNSTVTYTNNWPHEPLVGNRPTSANVLWSIISVVLLIGGIGVLVFYKAFCDREEEGAVVLLKDPLDDFQLTPSMKAVGKYCVTVMGLFALQVILGAVTAHFTVEGQSFFGFPLGKYLPYSASRTMHIQLGVFWIATSFMATGLFFAPLVSGREPRFQRFGVNLLFGALVLVVGGSLMGEWFSIQQQFKNLDLSFWWGHQGYEFVELGRAWQIALFIGLLLWLFLMLRALWPSLQSKGAMQPLTILFVGASVAIGLFYATGFFYSARTHLSVMEYWRWWVIHLWVEGFFEVFATTVLAFIFSKMSLIRPESATRAVLFSTSIFLLGGIPGTFHHLYWTGTPVSIMAIGSTFSALEVVPLALIGFEAWDTYKISKSASWMLAYRWPIRFFLGVTFWNLLGAGIFGFLINPPISLYYLQGLNTTPVHAHTALFGVYGLLSLGLILVILRRLQPSVKWREKSLSYSFWSMNIGLLLMVLLSLLPIGLLQAIASIDVGLWYARSDTFLQQPLIETLRWLRIVGDLLFMFGVASLLWFFSGLFFGWSIEK
jgi:nitric oxide reductase subunit B